MMVEFWRLTLDSDNPGIGLIHFVRKLLFLLKWTLSLARPPCADPESFVRGDPTISGPSTARQRNAFRWRADDGTTLNVGLEAL